MSTKSDLVGTEGYATKPQIPHLVEMIEKMLKTGSTTNATKAEKAYQLSPPLLLLFH